MLEQSRVRQVLSNSSAGVAVIKGLEGVSQLGHAIEQALAKQLEAKYGDIPDTAERLYELR